jgi:tRNA-specific 2-thiouridylase
MKKIGKKIVVAMSGGVDSSVAAALLRRRGFEVEGVYMRLFNTKDKHNERAAKAVAKNLGIGLKILDLRKEFKKMVIDYFLREFKAGRTPNPCVVCNQKIKFGLLLKKAMQMKADYIATGHYARRCERKAQSAKCKATAKNLKFFYLLSAKNKIKDQSYFLYNLTQEKLARILFPLGGYKKSEVYQMAEKWKLPYKKGESVDICFVGEKGHREFLKKHLGLKKGKIVDVTGKTLGEHQGIWFYTIGQRADVGGPGPFYVIRVDANKNLVVASNKFRGEELYQKELIAENVNWISGTEPEMPLKCRARIRYGHEAVPVVVSSIKYQVSSNRNFKVNFKNSQRAITPGQSVVFYKRNEVLGGGVISWLVY